MEAVKNVEPKNVNDGGIMASVSNAISNSQPAATNTAANAADAANAAVSAAANASANASSAASAAASAVSNAAASASENAKAAIASASVDNAKAAITNMLSFNENIFYLIIFLVLITIIVGYFLYYIITDNILYQQKIEVSGTEVPIICNELSEFKISRNLTNSNGIKRSYGFWIYINDINKYSGNFRHIAHVGDKHEKIQNASPYIFLDKTTNQIHFRFAPKEDIAPNTPITTTDKLNNIGADVNKLLKYDNNTKRCGITIKYVPIQRWVHVVVVISDANSGVVYTYIDGELSDVEDNKKFENKLHLHELNFENTGNLYVGGSALNSVVDTMGFSGLMSKFTLYNYDLNKNDIYKEYNKGPLNGLLTSMGIGSYGLRNPVYKLNTIS
jgi:uncharacterized protein YxeA